MDKHYKELDSLRGLAALTVMVQHILFLFPVFFAAGAVSSNTLGNLIKFTPLGIVFAGRQAVIFFFVLSGFVLSLGYMKPGKPAPRYGEFVIKRICRIYLPYLFALLLAVVMNMLCYKGAITGLSDWFQAGWRPQIDWHLVAQHLTLIGSFESNRFDPVFWTLVLEMRISLFVPLIAVCALKYDWKWNLAGGLLLDVAGWGTSTIQHLHLVTLSNDYLSTLCYILMFITGALLAKHAKLLAGMFSALSRSRKYLGLGVALLGYTSSFWLPHLVNSRRVNQVLETQGLRDLIVTASVAAFIIMSLTSGKASRMLTFGPVHFLGKISYSFYLFHAIWLLSFIHLLYGKIPLGAILSLVVVTAFVSAVAGYYWLELPSIKLGKWLVRKSVLT